MSPSVIVPRTVLYHHNCHRETLLRLSTSNACLTVQEEQSLSAIYTEEGSCELKKVSPESTE